MKKIFAFILFIASNLAFAQSQIFNIIYTSGPGSGTVVAMDIYSECLKNKNIIMTKEYKPGADGLIAIRALQQSIDTNNITNIMMGGFGVNVLSQFDDVDMLKDISPLVYTIVHDMVILTKPGNYNSVEELVQISKQKPLNIGSSSALGNYIVNILFPALNINYQLIPYKNSSQLLTDNLSGVVDLTIDTFAGSHSLVENGKLKIVMSTLDKRRAQAEGHASISNYTNKLEKLPIGSILNVKPSLSAERKKFIINSFNECAKDKDIVEKLLKVRVSPGRMSNEEVLQMIKENRKGK